MRRVTPRFWALSGVIVALNMVGIVWIHHDLAGRRHIRIVSALPVRDVDVTDRFTLVFNDAIAGASTGQRLERPPFVIEPRPDGHWQWAAPDRLDYVLDRPLSAGRTFRLRPSADLESQIGGELSGRSEFEFRTRPLRVMGCWTASADRTHANIELVFNQPVHPSDLLRHVKVSTVALGGPPAITCPTREAAERLSLRVERSGNDRITLSLDPGLTGHGGQLGLGEPFSDVLDVAPDFRLLRADVSMRYDSTDAVVRLCFSRRLDSRTAVPPVSLWPVVKGVSVNADDDDLRLVGAFESGRRYTATVSANLLADGGEPLGEDQSVSFEIPDREPAVRFPVSTGFLHPAGNLLLDVEVVNVAGLDVTASQVFSNNLAAHLRGEDQRATSREIAHRTIAFDQPRNKPATLAVDLMALLGSSKGIYKVEADATDRHWTGDSAVVVITDLSLTCKMGPGEWLVWVTSLSTAKPVAGSAVSAVSYSNQVLCSAVTGDHGLARLPLADRAVDEELWLVTAQLGDDLTFLVPADRPWGIDGADVSGRQPPQTYDVMLYAERGVYRPGDTVHLTGIIRDAAGDVPPAFPMAIAVERPDGRSVAELIVQPADNGQGTFHTDFATRDDGQLGRYRFNASLPGSEDVLGQATVLVEEFVPVRIELHAGAQSAAFGPDEVPQIDVSARYLFGQPAAGLPLAVTTQFRSVPFASQQQPEFAFGDPKTTAIVSVEPAKLSLDDDGRAQVELPVPGTLAPGCWRCDVGVTVTEPGGRSVSDRVSLLKHTAERFVGLRLPAGKIVPTRQPFELDWVQVTDRDEPAEPSAFELTLRRIEYDTVLQEVDGRRVWKSTERPVTVWQQTVEPAGAPSGSVELTCPIEGRYRITAEDTVDGTVTALEFDASSEAGTLQTMALNRPERLELTLDRDAYSPGSMAKLLVRSPLAGTLLLTLESDRVLDARTLEMAANSVEVKIPVPSNLRGGAFITASVVRAVDPRKDTWLPHRAFGMTRLRIDASEHELSLVLRAPEQVLPGQTISLEVSSETPADLQRPAVVHVWCVDEGVLLTSAYGTPDPLAHFFEPWAATVTSADTFADLLPDQRRPADMARIGGDSDADKDGLPDLRRSPVAASRRPAHELWNSFAPLGTDGTARFELPIPEMTGELRIMAVAVDRDRYAAAEHALIVTAPLLMEMGWPRFAAPGDRFDVPVKLFNSADEATSVVLNFERFGPIEIESDPAWLGVTVEPGEPRTIWLRARATAAGAVQVCASATATIGSTLPIAAAAVGEFPVRPATAFHRESTLVRLRAGESRTVDPPVSFLAGATRTTVSISPRPTVELRPALEALLDYPHGCVEQTTSRLWALLYAGELLFPASESVSVSSVPSVSQLVDAGIARLWSMQTISGGLSYWPGEVRPNLWCSAATAEFLIRARQAGHAVPDDFIGELLGYLKSSLDAHAYDAVDDNTRALICFVLAASDQAQHGWMARLAERPDRLDVAGRAHLAAAYLAAGRRDRAGSILTDDTLSHTIVATAAGRLTSQVHQEAVLLSVLLDLDPEHAWISMLVARLEAARARGRWGNTLESAAALAALARYQLTTTAEESNVHGTVTHQNPGRQGRGPQGATERQVSVRLANHERAKSSDDVVERPSASTAVEPAPLAGGVLMPSPAPARAGETFTFDFRSAADVNDQPANFTFTAADGPVTLTCEGSGSVYAAITNEGLLREEALTPFDRQLEVRRRWTDRLGEPLDRYSIAVGDLIYVDVTLRAPFVEANAEVQAIAIVDALPAGLEIENPALAVSDSDMLVLSGQSDRIESRDDRVLIYTTAGREPRTYRYALRATTAGTFTLPPIEASSMYDPAFASLSGGGQIEVSR